VALTLLSIDEQTAAYLGAPHALCEKKPVARRTGHRRDSRSDGALAYHLTANASLSIPENFPR